MHLKMRLALTRPLKCLKASHRTSPLARQYSDLAPPQQPWKNFPLDVQKAAVAVEHARSNNYQIPPLSSHIPDLEQKKSYQITAAIRAIREGLNGEVVAGRKIGFTNKNIWPEYGIDASNWSYMYNTTITQYAKPTSMTLDLSREWPLQPKIEPEVVLGLSREVSPSMDDGEILACIEWIAFGFEFVMSIFPDWKFTAADTTAAYALHGQLHVGPGVLVERLTAQHGPRKFLKDLETFRIELFGNGEKVDEGTGSNVLGSPIKALRHLAELLETDDFNPRLTKGEIVTTGTLTRALDVKPGDVWSTRIEGLDMLRGTDSRSGEETTVAISANS